MCVVQQWSDALFLSKRLATFDFLNVLWDPSTGLNAFCRRCRSRRTSVGAHFTPDCPLGDAWLHSPDSTWGGVAPDIDTDRGDTLELAPLRLLTAGGKDHENPEDLHSRGAQAARGATTTPSSVAEGSARWSPMWGENDQNAGRQVVVKPTSAVRVLKGPQWGLRAERPFQT